KRKRHITLPSEMVVWQPEFTDKTLSRKTGAVHDDLQSVYWDVLERIKREFDSEGISFPYPQMDIHLVRSGKQAESVTHNSRSVSSRQ
ncbi:hypothetical protein L2V98_24960, partial [Escherichia coli]|nr:hypothetical protein [Escherichia coli]